MSELLNSETFGDRIYDKFPEMYKRDDKLNDYQLKRYIQTAGEGFKCVIDETNGISDLRDSDKVDKSILPFIYSSHGLDIFNGIPETYLRNLVPILNSLFSRKGSMSAIEYLCSVVSGVKCTVSVDHFSENNRVDILIDMDNSSQQDFPSIEQLNRIIKEFIPFYCNTSLVFTYIFMDSFGIVMRDITLSDDFMLTHKDSLEVSIEDKLEDELVGDTEENYFLFNDTDMENSNFLNDVRLSVTNNIFLNTCNGYDTITVNGTTTVKTYNF